MDREHASQQAEGSQFVIDNLDDQVGKLSTALEDVKEQCKQLKAREQELLTRLAQQREELNKLQDAEATHLRHLGEAKQRAAELGASNEKLQQLVLHLRGEITGITTNMRARAATFVAEKKAWDKRVSELFNRLHEAEEAETQARLENTELAELLKASTSEVELMAAQIKALEQQGQDWRSITREEKDKHTQDVEQYMAREVELEGEIERRGLRIAALMRDAEEQRQLLDEQKAIVRGLTNMLDETEAAKGKQAAQAEGNFADLRVVADDYATQAAELSNALRALREEYAGMMHEKNGTITAREDELRRILEHNGALQAECARMVSEKESAIATMADEIKRARELNGALAGKAATRKGKIRTLDEQLAKLLRDLEQTRASLQTQTEEAVAAKQTLAQIRALSIGGL
jgi:predicted  nucleic acid-binding Zn-ribbon protein